MNFRVDVDGRDCKVAIENLRARPIVAFVEGERIEVWPAGRAAGGSTDGAPRGR